MNDLRAVAALAIACLSGGALGDDIPWPSYGGAPGGGHYSPGNLITPDNVARLGVAWEHRSGDFVAGRHQLTEEVDQQKMLTRPTSFQGTPIVVNKTLYYCTPFNRVFALDPASGEERWVYDPGIDMSKEAVSNCRGVSYWEDQGASGQACSKRIITGTLDARLIALDADTGKPCEAFGKGGAVSLTEGQVAHAAHEYSITSAPAILGDLLISGAFVLDSQHTDVPSGVVRAYSVRTGEFVWGWNPTHPEREQRDADGKFVAGTTNVWSTISVDEELGLVIVPTGNSSPDYYGGHREGHLDYYSSSIVALHAYSGEVAWHFQTVHHDIWDMDVPAQPTFADLRVNGELRPAVVQVTKMGMTFILDRRTGEPLFPIEERPVPQEGAVSGEYLSPTQPFPTHPAYLHQLGLEPDDAWGLTFWDRGRCRDKLASLSSGEMYAPPSLEGTISYPSQLGGNNWGSPAIEPARNVMIASTSHLAMELKLVPQDECGDNVTFPQTDSPYCVVVDPILSPLGVPCSAPPWATLAAVDLEGGDILWQVPLGTLEGLAPWPTYHFIPGGMQMGGPIVTAGGLVFIGGTTDAYLRAYHLETGQELWRHSLASSGNAVPMSYVYRGEQYVVMAAGGHFSSPQPASDQLVAFKLKPTP